MLIISRFEGEELKGAIFPVLVNALNNGKKHPVLAGLIGMQSLISATTIGVSLASIFKESIKSLSNLANVLVTQILTDVSRLGYQNPSEVKTDVVEKIMDK